MKKFGMGAASLFIGSLMAGQVAAKDMNNVDNVNLQTDGKDSIFKENPLLLSDNVKDSVTNTLNKNKYSFNVSPTGEDSLGGNVKLSPSDNFELDFGIRQNIDSGNNDTIGSVEMRYLLSAVDAGLSVSFEKGSEFQKIMGTIVKGYEGGTIKLSIAQLNKLTSVYFGEVDRTFEETLNQTAIGLEVSRKLSGFINEIRFGVNYYNVGSEDLGKIGTDVFETANDITTTDYYGAIQGGEKIQAGVETDMMLTDDLLVTLGLGLENYKYNGVNEKGDEGTDIYGTAGFDYRVTMQDLISGSYSRGGNNEVYKIELLHSLTNTLDWTIGYMYENNFEGIGSESKLYTELMYRFGGNSGDSRISEKFDRANKTGKLTLNDIRAIRAIATDQIQMAKKELTKKVTVEKKNVVDTTLPVLELVGLETVNLTVGDTYTEQGATASDNADGDISGKVVIGGDTVNTAVAGTYVVTYDVIDTAGNVATQLTRTVIVSLAPVIDGNTILGAPNSFARTHNTINVSGWTFTDTDGVQNVTVNLYSDAGLTNLVQTTTDGKFTGLNPSTTYFAAVEGDAKNLATGLFEHKKSSALVASTDALPPATSMNFFGTTPSEKNTAYNNFSIVANTTIRPGSTLTTSSGAVSYTISGNTVTVTSWAGTSANEVFFYLNQPGQPQISLRQILVDANTAPTVTNDTVSAGFTGFATGDVADNAYDAESADSELTFTVVSQPTHGTLNFTGTGYTYTSDGSGFGGTDTGTYKAIDPQGFDSIPATITIENIIDL